jgi:polyribonucleotide nucleotidyltransferase
MTAPVPERVELTLGGSTLSIETRKIAKQADGAVTVRMGDTVVLVTACMAPEPKDAGFVPLTCDYRENTYAAGKIPGGFFRREGRPNDKETLTSRLIDRPIRPLFPDGYCHETQVIALVLSYDGENDPAPLAMCGASAALYLSKIPFRTPIASVRVGLVDGQFVVNPTKTQLAASRLDLMMAGSHDAIVMVEAGASEVSEAQVVDALVFGHEHCRRIVAAQKDLFERLRIEKVTFESPVLPDTCVAEARERIGGRLWEALHAKPKRHSYALVDDAKKALLLSYPETDTTARKQAARAFEHVLEDMFRKEILQDGKRSDGRRFTEIRPIACEVGVLPRTHGSALFTRGETQALVTTTLGTSFDAQKMDWIEGEWTKRFMLHYNFPPFSVGEVKFLRGPGRREIGHGALAERALKAVVPGEDDFPYTIRIVSDILESNGSSSMASICGGTLCLMDAGVPVRSPVAGIAMGLVSGGGKHAVLTDIAGQEDHHGDMDFKVAGTREGITALQMDIKVEGLSREILQQALDQARDARLFILDRMMEALAAPRTEISVYAPRIVTVMIPRAKIGAVIGPGGKTIRSIIERTGVKIEVDDDGKVTIASVDGASAETARRLVEELTAEAEVGKTYLGRVVRIVDFGAFVEILPGVDGLVHVSELDDQRVREVRDVLEEGDEVLVKVIDIDQNDRIRLSRREALAEARGEAPARAEGDGPRDDDRGGPPPRDDRGGDRPPRSDGFRGGDRGPRPDRGGGRGGHRGGGGGYRGGGGGGGGRGGHDRGGRPPR